MHVYPTIRLCSFLASMLKRLIYVRLNAAMLMRKDPPFLAKRFKSIYLLGRQGVNVQTAPNINNSGGWRKILNITVVSDGSLQYEPISRGEAPPVYRRLAVYSTYPLGLIISEVRVLGTRKLCLHTF